MSSSTTPAITIVEPSLHDGEPLQKVPTNGSLSAIDEDREHAQDWTVTTDEKDSWAHREKRKSSVWGKLELIPAATSPTKKKNFMTAGGQPRRGSILSMWEGGKDKDGRDILAHDDHSDDEEEESVGSPGSEELPTAERERRGSILSVWKKGKDEHGNHAIIHDDEEWKEVEAQANANAITSRRFSATKPKPREDLPTSSFFV